VCRESKNKQGLRRAKNKLSQATFHLARLKSEIERPQVQLLAIESYVGGCLGAVQSAFFVLRGTQFQNFKTVYREWRMRLSPDGLAFLHHLMAERDADVHHGGSSLHLNLTIQPGGTPPQQTEFRLRSKEHHMELAKACESFIALMADLTKHFEEV